MKIKLLFLAASTFANLAFGEWHESTVPLGMEYWAEKYTQEDAKEIVLVLNGVNPTNPDVEALEAKWQQRMEEFGAPSEPGWEYWADAYTYQDAEEIVWVLQDINPRNPDPDVEALKTKWKRIMAQFGQKALHKS